MVTLTFDPDQQYSILSIDSPIANYHLENIKLKLEEYIKESKTFKGLIIMIRDFPGYENIDDIFKYLTLSNNAHQSIPKIGILIEKSTSFGYPSLAHHFSGAEIIKFEYKKTDDAVYWLTSI